MEDFEKIIKQFESDKLTRDMLKKTYDDLCESKKSLKTRLDDAESARIVIQRVAKKILSNLEFHISNLVTIALASVSDEWPEFIARVENRRNQTEIDLLFKEFGVEQKPLKSSGFGAVNVAAFTLRPSFWKLKKRLLGSTTRPVFLLDEPFRDVSPGLQEKVSKMVKMISELGIQFLIISHADDIHLAADKTFNVTKSGKISSIEEVE